MPQGVEVRILSRAPFFVVLFSGRTMKNFDRIGSNPRVGNSPMAVSVLLTCPHAQLLKVILSLAEDEGILSRAPVTFYFFFWLSSQLCAFYGVLRLF